MKDLIRVAVVGCGGRGMGSYAPLVSKYGNAVITAAVEPVKERREYFADTYSLRPEQCYETAEEFFSLGKLADVALICTQDQQHYEHTMNALKQGYDILLEKPISNKPEHCIAIAEEARRLGRMVAVCHVLRYAPFYQKLKQLTEDGTIGQVVALHQFENVGWWHYAHSFVRGNWSNSELTSPMILAKCCHDLDIILWLIGRDCLRVSSYGSLTHFKEDQAPAESTERCSPQCSVYDDCPYNAHTIYRVDRPESEWQSNEWPVSTVTLSADRPSLLAALESKAYGRCVYRSENNVVDHQITNMEFEGGATASLTMCAFTSEMTREIKVMGTHGEITGHMENGIITVKRFGKPDEVMDMKLLGSDLTGHGGGESNLMRDFFLSVQKTDGAGTLTSADKSVQSHIMAFAAERSRMDRGRSVELDELYNECNAPRKPSFAL